MKRAYQYSVAAQVWALREYGEVGPRTFGALMAYFGNLAAILEAEEAQLREISGLGEIKSRRIAESFDSLPKAEQFVNGLKEREIGVATIFDTDYPPHFRELNDPPPIIFYRGRLPSEGEKTVALVGSHNATNEGIQNAVQLSGKLAAQSVSVVSGLARGIDTAAHIGALKAGGKSYAVLGSGFDHIHPEENRALAVELVDSGALISEYSPDAEYTTGRILARNRLTVGLSQAVVIGELFGDSSGTLDTATFCQETGKLMFVLIDGCERPGKDNRGVEKTLALGAIPITLNDGVDIVLKSLV
jgi:DNA processing protein